MCGIAGLFLSSASGYPEETHADALKALSHRGPDGQGWYESDRRLLLAHTRLSIIDREGGHQPLCADDGSVLVANGEIYNDLEIRDCESQRQESGFPYRTGTDSESILALYRRLGFDFATGLRGMYACALYDPERGVLVLARDPFGIKPLYYTELSSGMAFASEPQALIRMGVLEPQTDRQSVGDLLQLQFSIGRETPFRNIHRVLPGETLVFSDGRVIEKRRHALFHSPEPHQDVSERALLTQLDQLLRDSIRAHLRSDVPLGLFLSGGIDSSVLLTLMCREGCPPEAAFNCGFSDGGATDERAAAAALGRHFGVRVQQIEVGERDFVDLLPSVAAALDDPISDYAALPTYKLAREAGKSLKVVFSGEGGDELFAGYGRHRKALRWYLPGTQKHWKKGIMDGLDLLLTDHSGWRPRLSRERPIPSHQQTALQKVQDWEFAGWLANDLMTKLDRCLMAHGVEGRVPFLDQKLASFAYHLPDRYKVRGGMGKWLLRRWLETHVPNNLADRPKQGFTVPIGYWLERHGPALAPLVASQAGVAETCDAATVRATFQSPNKRNARAAWSLLMLALWHQIHIRGVSSEGTVYDVLGSPCASSERHRQDSVLGLAGSDDGDGTRGLIAGRSRSSFAF